MAQSKLECMLNGVNTFLSGKMYAHVLKEKKENSWQRNAYIRGYNFAFNLYLEGHKSFDNIKELFEVFTKEPLDKNVKKHCVALKCVVQSSTGHEITVTLPVMTSTQFFCSTVNKAVTDVNEVKRKVQEFVSKENYTIIHSDIV